MQNEGEQLIIQFEGNVIQTHPLTQAPLTIGRAPDVGVTLPHPLVSRAHVELRLEAQGLIITDLGSSNGTYIGTERLAPNQPRILIDGMSFRIGPYTMIYRTGRAAQMPSEMVGEMAVEMEPAMEQAGQELPIVPPSTSGTPAPTVGRPVTDEPVPMNGASSPIASEPTIEPTRAMSATTNGHNGHNGLRPYRVPQAITPFPRRLPITPQSIYSRNLPDIYSENDFLQRFLYIFEDIWEPLEQRQDHISMYFDPRTCPAVFLPWLASWLGLSFNPHWPEARRRRLLSQAMDLYRWRGTRYGLTRMIEVCTGITPEITENPLEPFVFRIRIALPPAASADGVDRRLIEELIQTHKPAHAGYILEVY